MVDQTAPVIGGKYRLERQIGSGGMGSIWVAFDQALHRQVAVKLMRTDQLKSAQSRDNFANEARAAARLQHPNVVQIYDYGIDERDGLPTPYIVMELLTGEDLSARLVRQRQLSLAAVVAILAPIARALLTAHGFGLVHRDLKPANLFLAQVDGREVPKILDFGVAALLASNKDGGPGPGMLIGTPQYMSPEQVVDASRVDHRTDLYALGVVAYEALTGTLPFEIASLGDLVQRATSASPPLTPASTRVPTLGPAVDAFFEKALAAQPAQRFQSARELAIALSALEESGGERRAIRIVVTDDEPDLSLLIRQRFRQQIKKAVYDFHFASDGYGALELLRKTPDVDLVLSDINMPGMDGLSLLEHVSDVNPLVKVVMVSAYGDFRNIREAMNRGAFDFLTKPIDFKDLERTIDKTVQHVGANRRAARIAEEHALLRMFVNSGIVEKLIPMMRAAEQAACEQTEATVVFILLRGFESSEGQPPDAVLRATNSILDRIVSEVHIQNGVVEKFIGHGVFAVFRGDGHLERAVRTCFAVHAALPRITAEAPADDVGMNRRIQAAIGIDSGQVLAGGVGSRQHGRMDYTVLGNVVATALRMAVYATPDQTTCSEQVAHLLRSGFVCESAGTCSLPNHDEPQPIWNIVRETQQRVVVVRGSTGNVAKHAQLDTLMTAATADDPSKIP
mgnify:FL=1|jgi:serine/threonine protein kinase/class 3 adenylate cyclase